MTQLAFAQFAKFGHARPPMAHAKPVVKWLGGKSWLTGIISDGIYQYLYRTQGRYFEPFLGGGAVALDLGIPNMVLSDSCGPLMTMYDVVRRNSDDVIALLDQMAAIGTDEATYYAVRTEAFTGTPIEVAAQLIYLNKLGYNGVFRVNKQGGYNVPYGSDRAQANPASLFNYDGLRAVGAVLATAKLQCADFRDALESAGTGDVIFADCPYASTFTGYSKCSFSDDDQHDLSHLLFEAWEAGAVVLATNADHPNVRAYYKWAKVTGTQEARSVNRKASGRGKIGCVLISSPGAEILLGSRNH